MNADVISSDLDRSCSLKHTLPLVHAQKLKGMHGVYAADNVPHLLRALSIKSSALLPFKFNRNKPSPKLSLLFTLTIQVQLERTMRRVISMEANIEENSIPLRDVFGQIALGQYRIAMAQVKVCILHLPCRCLSPNAVC